MSAVESLIASNLIFVAAGHFVLVLILVFIFFGIAGGESLDETNVEDEDAFDYDTESGAMFRSPATENLEFSKKPSDDDGEGGIDEPIVFNSQISEESIPDTDEIPDFKSENGEEFSSPREESPNEVEEEPEPSEKQVPQETKEDRIDSIFEDFGPKPVFAITRDEVILDLNQPAKALFGYEKGDVELKKIDEIVTLEETEENDTKSDPKQLAKGLKKDGSTMPISVELEMADREFGIITVLIHEDADTPAAEPATPEPEDPPTVEEVEEAPEVIPMAVAKPQAPAPPPPPPKKKPSSDALKPTLASKSPKPLATPSSGSLDNKTVEMFSSQLSQPIQSIIQLADLIANDDSAIPHLKKYAVAIQAKSNRMMSQIEEMSVIASAQKGQLEMDHQPFNLSATLKNMVNLADTTSNGQKVNFQKSEQDLIVVSDSSHFEKMLGQLLTLSMESAGDESIDLIIDSSTGSSDQSTQKEIQFEGQNLQINGLRNISIATEFSGDENSLMFFDTSINRSDNSLVQRLQASGSMKNFMTNIRLMKELASSLGGTVGFSSIENTKGRIEFNAEIPAVEVGEYPT